LRRRIAYWRAVNAVLKGVHAEVYGHASPPQRLVSSIRTAALPSKQGTAARGTSRT
jgi:hypothetical protein